MRVVRPTLLVALLCVAATSTSALTSEARGAMDGDEPRVRARLLVDPEPGASHGRVGVLFSPSPGWHLYWRNPGHSGLAPALDFRFEGGAAEAGEIAWPAPRAFAEDVDILTYGYEGEVLLAAPVAWSADPPRAVRVDARVLVCAEQCIPAELAMRRRFEPAGADTRALFEAAALRVPPDASERGVQVSLSWPESVTAGDRFAAALRVEPCAGAPNRERCGLLPPEDARAAFFPHDPDTLRLEPVAITARGAGFRIELAGHALAEPDPETVVRGVVALRDAGGEPRAFEVALPVAGAQPHAAAGAGVGALALLQALVLGVLGGLILNLMPCVLPVLAIKVCAVAELAQRGRREVIAHAFAYTAGILATLTSLALCVVALRWSGTAVGWGFHLQEPVFVMVVAAVLVTFAMNLLGAFEFGPVGARLGAVGASAAGARRSFFDGLLAVVLATPCSAPFLGTAVGFAFASPAPVIVAIFLAIGLGLAAPFLLVAVAPGGSRWMPRAGPWMLELRRGLGFALLATVVWLLWIVGGSTGADAMAALLALLLAIAFVAWIFGLAQRRRGHAPALALVAAVAAVLLAGLDRIELSPRETPEHSVSRGTPLPYSPAALGDALASGRPAFVYYTADWCLTCKLNERRVLADPRARAALEERGFAVLRADWTRRDETIRRELAKLGKAGVPVYALYAPGRPDAPRLLPEILGLESFLNAVAEVAEETPTAAARRAGSAG